VAALDAYERARSAPPKVPTMLPASELEPVEPERNSVRISRSKSAAI